MPRFLNWADAAAALTAQGSAYVLVTVLDVKGSAPREAGTKMLVTADASVDTIGGGQLEFIAIQKARQLLLENRACQLLEEFPLGPKLGQCCGGRVSLLLECFAASAVQIALFGAGHVGRALVSVLAQLPVQVRWIDSRAEQFPDDVPANVKKVVTEDPEAQIATLQPGAYVVVMTHDHPLDYAIAEAALKRNDTAYLGVIGSDTKARRFRMRLAYWGFSAEHIAHMRCPMGLAAVPGKKPMEVAVSVAAEIIGEYQQRALDTPMEQPGMRQPVQENPGLQHQELIALLNEEHHE